MVDDVERWRGRGIPLTVDVIVVLDVERSPGDVLLRHRFLEFTWFMGPGIDADHSERLVFEIRHERPLVWPCGPSGQSVLAPEIQQHDVSTVAR